MYVALERRAERPSLRGTGGAWSEADATEPLLTCEPGRFHRLENHLSDVLNVFPSSSYKTAVPAIWSYCVFLDIKVLMSPMVKRCICMRVTFFQQIALWQLKTPFYFAFVFHMLFRNQTLAEGTGGGSSQGHLALNE